MATTDLQSSDFEQRTMQKLTWKLMPLLCACFMAAFLDRVNVGFAKEQMMSDLKFSDDIYSTGAGIFFVGYFLFEVPSNLIMERVGARMWIARIMIIWAFISGSMLFVKSETVFYVLRFFLGAAEAGFFPGVIFYLTAWFPRAYRSRTTAIFMSAAVLSGVLGNPISGLILEVDGAMGWHGWQWLFFLEALPSLLLGIVVLAVLPNKPADAKWLSQEEKDFVTSRIDAERKEVESENHGHLSVLKAFADPRVLLVSLVYFLSVCGAYGLDFFMPSLIKKAFVGASNVQVGLLAAVPPFLALFVMNYWGRSSDRKQERKFHVAAAFALAGTGLMLASLPVPPIVALVAMAMAVAGRWSAIAPFWGLSTMFLTGRAAAGAIALINSIGNLGGLVGPKIMTWFKDGVGDYVMGLRVLAGFLFVSAFIAATMKVKRAPVAAPQAAAAE
ncbi:MAG TPA: MFS transporter [Polyangiaceae bacterium]|nr:MFS transporter [Polyangiaceae bacterium]